MKIGIDARLWSQSGVGRYTRNLVREIEKIDRNNHYILFVLPEDLDEVRRSTKFEVVSVNVRWHSFSEQTEFLAVLNKYNLDLVHFPYFSMPLFYNGPFVLTVHDLILHHFSTGAASTLPSPLYKVKHLAYKFLVSQTAKKAKKIIAVSNTTKSEIVDHLGHEQKTEVIYEAADDLPKTTGKNFYGDYFLYVGNVYPHKNAEGLVDAFSELVNKKIKLLFAGNDDFFQKRLKEKVRKLNLTERIVFLGKMGDDELSRLYSNALAFVRPSFMEGFSLPPLEAMRNNCISILSDIPVHREICKDAALYFNPGNTFEIKNALDSFLEMDSSQKAKLKSKGVKVESGFSWKKMAEETLQVYESSLSIR
jgi:glycosyltransferase involved in cell wall biosynthesis